MTPVATSTRLKAVISTAPSPYLNIETRQPNDTWFEVGSTREMADVKVPTVTGTATIENFVARNAKQSTPVLAKRAPHLAASDLVAGVAAAPLFIRDLGSMRASLAYLADRKVGELDWAFRTTLDAYAYRLDAWCTSLANRRLEQLRLQRATGVHLGGYGWVENLKLETRPDSLGYVHAPSLAQAATAAILRSGHLANRERLAGAFNINLTSERTKRALGLLEGVAMGQAPAALLGYRFERGLRDALLGKYILPLRKAYPLRRGDGAALIEDRDRRARRRGRHGAGDALAGEQGGDLRSGRNRCGRSGQDSRHCSTICPTRGTRSATCSWPKACIRWYRATWSARARPPAFSTIRRARSIRR